MQTPAVQRPERFIQNLAQEFHLPFDVVAGLYERQRSELCSSARTMQFVHIFAMRNVEEILRERGSENGLEQS